MEENNKGVITVSNGVIYVKTNNVYQYNIDSLDKTINIPKGNYIIHINAKLFNNDITFLDKFDSIDEVLNNPFTINVNIVNKNDITFMILWCVLWFYTFCVTISVITLNKIYKKYLGF